MYCNNVKNDLKALKQTHSPAAIRRSPVNKSPLSCDWRHQPSNWSSLLFLDSMNFHLDNLNYFNKHVDWWRLHVKQKRCEVLNSTYSTTAWYSPGISIQYRNSLWTCDTDTIACPFILSIFIYVNTLKESTGSILISSQGSINFPIFENFTFKRK